MQNYAGHTTLNEQCNSVLEHIHLDNSTRDKGELNVDIQFPKVKRSPMLPFLLHAAIPPLGARPRTWAQYSQSLDEQQNTFACFDGSGGIGLDLFNDGFLDCPDGSDEPSTGASIRAIFYCLNEGIKPRKIQGWSVGDGICDCCDGSDEALNPRANCTNTCHLLAQKRDQLIQTFITKFKQGFQERDRLLIEGKELVERSFNQQTILQLPVRLLALICDGLGMEDETPFNRSQAYPSWAGPLVSLWKRTFNARNPRYTFGQVLRKAVIADLKKLSDWLFEKFRTPTLIEILNGVTPAAAPLRGRTYQTGEFQLTFLQKIKHGGLLLGKFANFTGDVMWFDGGDRCWKTESPRAFKLELLCNDENVFLSASESSTCVYEGIFATPLVCNSTEYIGIDNYKMKRLEAMAELYKLSV
jgi:hypothetical protein